MKQEFCIESRLIGNNYSPYVIAEMSANHNGDIDNAYKIIEMARLKRGVLPVVCKAQKLSRLFVEGTFLFEVSNGCKAENRGGRASAFCTQGRQLSDVRYRARPI